MGYEELRWSDRKGRVSIPMWRWHRHHWSLLMYVEETAISSDRGRLDWNVLNTSKRHWPTLFAVRELFSTATRDGADFGLRLLNEAGGLERMPDCCDVDALMDLVEEGLVTITMPTTDEFGNYLMPNGKPVDMSLAPIVMDADLDTLLDGHAESMMLMPWAAFRLTDKGHRLNGALRKYRSDPKNGWGDFDWRSAL